jgi:von Willebrand factor type A domain
VPLAAFVLMERRTRRLRRLFSLTAPQRRELAAPAVALAVIPALIAVAAAQPIIVRREAVVQREDAQAFFVLDTSLSMSAKSGPDAPTRLERAERDVETLLPQLGDIPVGLATMTDRVLPNLMPTTNDALILRTIKESIGINEPPPSRPYPYLATSFQTALFPLPQSNLFPIGMKHPILVIFTDGESAPLSSGYGSLEARQMTIPPLFVHVSEPNEHVYVGGNIDLRYHPDPQSGAVLDQFASATHGQVFSENDLAGLVHTILTEAGPVRSKTRILGFERVPLAPWVLLVGIVPLGFLFWRRNL